MHFDQSIGVNGLVRLRLRVSQDGFLSADYGHGVNLEIRSGWNDGCPMVPSNLSFEELRSLYALIGLVPGIK